MNDMTFTTLLTTLRAEPSGDGWLGTCPAHRDHNASLRIAVGQQAIMLKCRAGCATATILRQIGIGYGDLKDMHTGTVGTITRTIADDGPATAGDCYQLARQLDQYQLAWTTADADPAKVYAWQRFGAGPEEGSRLALGYAANLGGSARLVVPFCDPDGFVTGAQARALDDNPLRWYGFKNPPGRTWSKVGWFPATHQLSTCIMITEGPGDALYSACTLGIDAIAIRGAALSSNLLVAELITKWAAGRKLLVAGDGDAAGEQFNRNLVNALPRAEVYTIEAGKDLSTS